LTPDMSSENKEKFIILISNYKNKNISLEFLDAKYCEETVKSWGVPAHRGSYVTYYKLLLNHYFENKDVESVLHIGADTLVTGSLEELCDFDFKGNPIAMNWSEKLYERHFPHNYHYCIAEMVFFNLPEWRMHNCEERVRRHCIKIGDIYGSKDQGILNMEFQDEWTQLPLKYNIYGITYYFSYRNKRRFNNAPIITKREIEDAYANPQIIHIPRTFLYRPHEKGSREPLKEMWWHYLEKSPWKGMEKQEPYPPLGAKEKFLRYLYLKLPPFLAEPFYIICRQAYGWLNSVKCRPYALKNRCIGYRDNNE
jgi:lipopolysaccharide biosynthesis glycosyltransferase